MKLKITLTGPPGSGKTLIGSMLAEELHAYGFDVAGGDDGIVRAQELKDPRGALSELAAIVAVDIYAASDPVADAARAGALALREQVRSMSQGALRRKLARIAAQLEDAVR